MEERKEDIVGRDDIFYGMRWLFWLLVW
jgi:hypothetical protein